MSVLRISLFGQLDHLPRLLSSDMRDNSITAILVSRYILNLRQMFVTSDEVASIENTSLTSSTRTHPLTMRAHPPSSHVSNSIFSKSKYYCRSRSSRLTDMTGGWRDTPNQSLKQYEVEDGPYGDQNSDVLELQYFPTMRTELPL